MTAGGDASRPTTAAASAAAAQPAESGPTADPAPDSSQRRAPNPWQVTLVCGAAGVGKTRVAVALAARFDTPLAEADDIVTAVQALTTPEQLPDLHFWDAHPEAAAWPAEKIAELHFTVAAALRPALRAVIADHLAFDAPVVMEGDYVTPDLVAEFGDRVRAVVIAEDRDQILSNFTAREPAEPPQHHRAHVSALVTAELSRRAAAVGVPVVPARPWDDVVERALAALESADPAGSAHSPD